MAELDRISATVFGIPKSHYHCGFQNFDWSRVTPQGLKGAMETFLLASQEQSHRPPHLILAGETGLGKSHLGVAAYRWGVARSGTQHNAWVSVPKFCDEYKASYSEGGYDPIEDLEGVRTLLVLDDLFGRPLSQHEVRHIVYRLINLAHENNVPLLVTMNQTASDLVRDLPGHEVSRLLDSASLVPMMGKDFRRSRG